jgi:hypothetical protein
MPLVMLSSRLMVMFFHAGYCGSHFPTVSSIDNIPSASRCSTMTEVKALVLP